MEDVEESIGVNHVSVAFDKMMKKQQMDIWLWPLKLGQLACGRDAGGCGRT
jgi:hypothetical protein